MKDQCEKDAIVATLQNKLKIASMKIEDLEKKNGKARISLGEIAFLKLFF